MMELLAAFGIGTVVWYGGSSVVAGGRTPGGIYGLYGGDVLHVPAV